MFYVLLFFSIIYANLDISKYTLENGLELYISTNNRASYCAYSISFKVGSACEVKNSTGISHMLEHLMFKQLDGYSDGEIDRRISEVGGIGFNANTGRDYTNYIVEVPCAKLKTILEIDRDRLTKLRITQKSLNVEKQVVLSERKMRLENSAFGKMLYYVYQNLLAGSAYAHPIIGYTKDIKNYKTDTVLDYYRSYYIPNNATVVIVGGAKKDFLLNLVKETLGVVPRGKLDICEKKLSFNPNVKKQIFVKTNTKNDRIVISYRFMRDSKDDIFMSELLEQILSSGSKPLFNKFFMDKGLGYAGVYVDNLQAGISVLNFYAVSFSSKYTYKDLENNLYALVKYLQSNIKTELKRIFKLNIVEFYESQESNRQTRELIRSSIFNYTEFSYMKSLYSENFEVLLKKLKNYIDRVFSSVKLNVISRGIKR